MTDSRPTPTGRTAFVLGGGGVLGGFQAGMLQALFEAGVRPDLVIGTSVGSIQGAVVAANPTLSSCLQLAQVWMDFVTMKVMKPSLRGVLGNVRHGRAGLTSNEALSRMIVSNIGKDVRFEDLKVPFQCAAASIERSAARYFESGPLLPSLLASAAIPGLWPAVGIDGEHYLDGGLVDSLPVGRAASLGADTIYVLRLRQTDVPLTVPRLPWQVAQVAFELSRRNQVDAELARPRPGIAVHMVPSGEDTMTRGGRSARSELATIRHRISTGYESACRYLEDHPPTRSAG